MVKARLKKLLSDIGRLAVLPHLPEPAPDPRTSPATKAALVALANDLRARARAGDPNLPKLRDNGLRVFSQFEEDGYLLYLAAVLEIETRTFVDIGAADGINSNCANLALNLGWHGLFLEGSEGKVAFGRAFYERHPDTILYPPVFRQAFITAENINELVADAGFSGDLGVCSIDIDGNDLWVWQALQVVSPQVVVIETHPEFGTRPIAVPYRADHMYTGGDSAYFGAGPAAVVNMARAKGYRLVGANRYGFNLIFVRNDVFPDRAPEVALESVLTHRRYFERLKLFEPISDWEYVSV